MNCARSGCTGTIVDGYCDDCGMAPRPESTSGTEVLGARPGTAPSEPSSHRVAGPSGGTSSTRRHRLGRGLVAVPSVPARDPVTAIMAEAHVPEQRRFCGKCNEPVGRSRDGVAGRPEGFCRSCRHAFSFVAKLRAGNLVAGQYEVAGCLAHGGLGWIYLAKDRKVADRWVVLKGLINSGDEDALAAALAERRFLAQVEHPDIVKIHNFVEHDGDGYIVMEYVNGYSLRSLLEARRAAAGDRPDPMPVDQAIAYMLEILPALGHLHDLGLLFCDFKPDNVIRTPESVKLIDLGGVYRMDDATSPIYGTPGYQAPEIARTGPTVPSDLFTVARTLMVLCCDFRGYRGTYQYTLPPAADVPLFLEHDSLYRFLERATAADPEARFQSADEMAAQLEGVLREVTSKLRGTPTPGASACFTGESGRAASTSGWRSLPVPLVNPDDPEAAVVVTLGAMEPEAVVDALGELADRGVEVELRRVRALIDLDRLDEASDVLDDLDATVSFSGALPDWRVGWYRGVAALAAGAPADAARELDQVYRYLPGELAPKLALAHAAEQAGGHAMAAAWFDIVSSVDPGMTSSVFGLARARSAMGDRRGAIAAYERIPHTSGAYQAAQIAEVDLLLADDGAGTDLADVRRAAAIVEGLSLDRAQHDRLTVDILEAAHDAVSRNGTTIDPAPPVLGHALSDRSLRLGLEAAYRAAARHAATSAERIALVDQANRVRPWSWWVRSGR
jgi:serine/threonine-protein kinase PknG